MKSRQAHKGQRSDPRGVFTDLKGAQSDPREVSTTVTSLGCALTVDLGETPVNSRQAHEASDVTPALRVDFGETPEKSRQAHEASDLTPVKFSRT